MESWRLLPFRSWDPFEAMAVDEALFRLQDRRRSPPTLRFFGWTRRTVSIGYFQDVCREVNLKACLDEGVALVRRPTGGKAVIHDGDLCYSVTGRTDGPLFSGGLTETYRFIGQCLIRGLAGIGLALSMSGDAGGAGELNRDAFCFARPSRYEILVRGRKICGSAQFRSRGAFLQQGSLLMDFDRDLPDRLLKRAAPGGREAVADQVTSLRGEGLGAVGREAVISSLCSGFGEILGIPPAAGSLTGEEEALARELREGKYGTDAWNLEGKGNKWTFEGL